MMKYRDEFSVVRLTIKKAKRSGINAGFAYIKKYADEHENRDIETIIKCYRKCIKRGGVVKMSTYERKILESVAVEIVAGSMEYICEDLEIMDQVATLTDTELLDFIYTE